MRKLGLTIAVTLALGALGAGTASASGGLSLVEAGNSAFPQRAFILTLPHRASIGAGSVQVTEDGNSVVHLSVTPTGAEKNAAGTVLLIDASQSMTGKPIDSAMAAARAFAARRNSNQELALITFNSGENIVLPFTSDDSVISQALSRTPRLAYGTHIYDAVDAAIGLIQRAGLKAGTIVLLSDGADVGSTRHFADIAKELRTQHVRLFSVALKSGAFDPSTLQRLTTAGKGSFSVASSTANLAAIYDNLGFRLANEYLVEYSSLSPPDKPVRVRATVAGFDGAAIAGYRSPPLQLSFKPPLQPSIFDRVIESWVTMVVVAIAIVALIGFTLKTLLSRDTRSLQRRLSEFVSVAVAREVEILRREEVRAALARESNLQRFAFWRRFSEEAALADIRTPPVRLALYALVAAVALAIVGIIVLGSIGFLLGLVPIVGMRLFVSKKLKRKRALFADQLADNLEVLASALRAGHSLVGALAVVVDDAAEPSKSEFQRVLADEQLGVPLEQALGVTVKRMANRDLDQVAVVAVLQRDAGANSAEVLDQIVGNIRARQEIRRLVRVLTAQGRMARWIVSLLPLGLLIVISSTNPTYMHPMWHETVGHVFLGLATIMVIAGSIVIGRIVDIEV